MPALNKQMVINSALALTGNAEVVNPDDGSPEWRVGSEAWEAAIDSVLEMHSWAFATATATLNRNGSTSPDPYFEDVYDKPPSMLHLIWVRVNNAPTDDYTIIGNKLLANARGGTITVKYAGKPDEALLTPLFMSGMRALVMSGIVRGLNEDGAEADKLWMEGERLMQRARTRSDQELPRRPLFRSRVAAARRIAKVGMPIWGPSRWPWG
jgi:hypothetical protein